MEEFEKEALRKVLDYMAFQINLSAEVADAVTILETWEYGDRKGFNLCKHLQKNCPICHPTNNINQN